MLYFGTSSLSLFFYMVSWMLFYFYLVSFSEDVLELSGLMNEELLHTNGHQVTLKVIGSITYVNT